ncbi:hypothetical protein GCM10023080_017930 [Streptomyces pseudoechinosporeus]
MIEIEHGEVATLDVVARYVEALGGRLDLVADFGDHTVRMPAERPWLSPVRYRAP